MRKHKGRGVGLQTIVLIAELVKVVLEMGMMLMR